MPSFELNLNYAPLRGYISSKRGFLLSICKERMTHLIYSEFIFKSAAKAFEAFKNIGRGGNRVFESEGLIDVKMMGAGGGSGFSIFPDLRRYAVLLFFKTEQEALHYVERSKQLKWYMDGSADCLVCLLSPYKGHGQWVGVDPFVYDSTIMSNDDPIAVLTRATIRSNALPDFWRNVPKVAAFMHSAPALHQVGIGEYPIFMQATFSIWKNLKSLKETAYTNTPHAEVVKKTRERNWYKEELFAEFAIRRLRAKGEKFERLKKLNITPL